MQQGMTESRVIDYFDKREILTNKGVTIELILPAASWSFRFTLFEFRQAKNSLQQKWVQNIFFLLLFYVKF